MIICVPRPRNKTERAFARVSVLGGTAIQAGAFPVRWQDAAAVDFYCHFEPFRGLEHSDASLTTLNLYMDCWPGGDPGSGSKTVVFDRYFGIARFDTADPPASASMSNSLGDLDGFAQSIVVGELDLQKPKKVLINTITAGGSNVWKPGDVAYVRLRRDPLNANDDLGQDLYTLMSGLYVEYTKRDRS